MVVPPSPPARRAKLWILQARCDGACGEEFRITFTSDDLSLRTDIVDGLLAQLLRGITVPHNLQVTLQRPGTSWPHDEDQAWGAAVRHALAARALSGEFVVKTSRR